MTHRKFGVDVLVSDPLWYYAVNFDFELYEYGLKKKKKAFSNLFFGMIWFSLMKIGF